jgi:phosphoglycerate dehydrogenase-like enzyme
MENAAIDLRAAEQAGVLVCGTRSLRYPTAELTWGLILALVRRIPAEDAATRAGRWQTTIGTGLQGKTIGLLGLGHLGAQVAKIARAFGMDVWAWSANLTVERARECRARAVAFEELLAGADIVSIHLRLGERTRGLLGADQLALMKPSAYLVNTSRGPIVDENALVTALTEQRIAGAALDVFAQEPLPSRHPVLNAPHTVVTPHIGYVTRETYAEFFADVVDNIDAYVRGDMARVRTVQY